MRTTHAQAVYGVETLVVFILRRKVKNKLRHVPFPFQWTACLWLAVISLLIASQGQAQHWYDDNTIYTPFEEPVGLGSHLYVQDGISGRILNVTPEFESFASAESVGAVSGSIISVSSGLHIKRATEELLGWVPWPDKMVAATFIEVTEIDVTNITVEVANISILNVTEFHAGDVFITNATVTNNYVTNNYVTNEYVTNVTAEVSVVNIQNVTEQYVVEQTVYKTYLNNTSVDVIYNTTNVTEIFNTIFNQTRKQIDKETLAGVVDGVNNIFYTQYPFDADSVSVFLLDQSKMSYPLPLDHDDYVLEEPNKITINFIPPAINPYTQGATSLVVVADYETNYIIDVIP